MSPYRILGVSSKASDEEVRRAYKALAKKHHPDLNPDDPSASIRMGEINQAYSQVLAQRKRFAPQQETPYTQAEDPFKRFYSAWDASADRPDKRGRGQRRRRLARWKSDNAAIVVIILILLFLMARVVIGMLIGGGTPALVGSSRNNPTAGYSYSLSH